MGGRLQEGGDMGTCVCIWLICFVVQQKLTQYCEAIILQQRSIKKKKNVERQNLVCEPTVITYVCIFLHHHIKQRNEQKD